MRLKLILYSAYLPEAESTELNHPLWRLLPLFVLFTGLPASLHVFIRRTGSGRFLSAHWIMRQRGGTPQRWVTAAGLSSLLSDRIAACFYYGETSVFFLTCKQKVRPIIHEGIAYLNTEGVHERLRYWTKIKPFFYCSFNVVYCLR